MTFFKYMRKLFSYHGQKNSNYILRGTINKTTPGFFKVQILLCKSMMNTIVNNAS